MYFSTKRKGWYKLDQVNLDSSNLSESNTWIDVARFDNDDVEVEFILFRSAYDEDGNLIDVVPSNDSTTTISFRIVQPNSVAGTIFMDQGTFTGGPTKVNPIQWDWEPPLNIPQGSKLQVKLNTENTFDTAKFYFLIAFLTNGVNPAITYLFDS